MSVRVALFADLSDDALLERVGELVRRERRATAQLIGALAELERRKLYLAQGCASMFTYCTQVLHLSEHAAYNRIEAARAAMRFPAILEQLENGSITLTAVRLLAPLLTLANHEGILAQAVHKTRKEIEVLATGLRPLPDAKTIVRRLPDAAALGPPTTISVALTPERYKIQFTASRQFHDKLRRAQAWLRHTVPNGDAGEILERALDLLLADVAKRQLGATDRPRASKPLGLGSRHIPAAVKREVWKRDGGRCAFVGSAGRCTVEGFLEFHHVVAFADGGPATTTNIELRCRAHNSYESDRIFKPMFAE